METIVSESGTGKYAQDIKIGAHTLKADEPLANGGNDSGPSPYDFLLDGLGACTSILCQTKRSLNRCKQRLMQVLQERRLRLSGKKTRIGSIDKGFHFLGIQYPKTQPLDNTTMTQAVVNAPNTEQVKQNQSKPGG